MTDQRYIHDPPFPHFCRSIPAKASRGELVPQAPRDEPASELLARTRTAPEALGTKRKITRRKRCAGMSSIDPRKHRVTDERNDHVT